MQMASPMEAGIEMRRLSAVTITLAAFGLTAALVMIAGCPPEETVVDDTVVLDEELVGEPIRIGGLFAITGAGSSLGEPARDTAVMLAEHINAEGGTHGRPVEIVVRDTKSLETDALNAAMELADRENVLAILGPSRSGTTMAVVDYVERTGVPLISCAAARKITDPVKDYVFQVAPGDADAVYRIYDYMREEGISKIATLTASSGFGEEGRAQLQAQAADFDIEILAAEQFADDDNDMTAQLTSIRGTEAEAVVCWGVGRAPALVARNMTQLGMQIPLFQSHGVANQRFIDVAADAAEGVIMPAAKLIVLEQLPEDEPQLDALRQYHEMFVDQYEREPDHYGGHGWDALQIVREAIERAGPDVERETLRDEIENTQGHVGIAGIFNYASDDHYGLTPDAFVMVTIEDGRWQLLD